MIKLEIRGNEQLNYTILVLFNIEESYSNTRRSTVIDGRFHLILA